MLTELVHMCAEFVLSLVRVQGLQLCEFHQDYAAHALQSFEHLILILLYSRFHKSAYTRLHSCGLEHCCASMTYEH